MKKNNLKIVTFLTTVTLLISLFSAMPVMSSEEGETDIVLVGVNDENELNWIMNAEVELIHQYEDHVLLEAQTIDISYMEMMGLSINHLEHGNRLYVNGYDFSVQEGDQMVPETLRVDEYGPGVHGLYIIQMRGPIANSWRSKLEDMKIDILSYMHNNAYKVRMTQGQADEVRELNFVNWVGIYQPSYKLQPDMELGEVYIGVVAGSNIETLKDVGEIAPILSITDMGKEGFLVRSMVMSKNQLHDIALINDVTYITQYNEPTLLSEVDSQIIGGGAWYMDDDGDPSTPYRAYGDYGAYINQIGYTGSGVTVAVADTGLGDGTIGNAGHVDFTGRVVGGYYWSGSTWADGHGHGTHCTGSIAGDTYGGSNVTYAGHGPYYVAQGLAYNSQLYGIKIFTDAGGWSGPGDYFEIVEVAAQNSDTYVHSNSWGAGTSGSYGESDSVFDAAVRDADRVAAGNQPMVITVAAGNDGPGYQTVGSPGNAKNVITIGATESYMPDARSYGNKYTQYDNPDNVVSFSSRGWTADSRVKPDVVAPGGAILSTSSPVAGDNLYGIYSEDSRYEWCDGTSMANPAVAGAASVTVEWYEVNHGSRPSPAMVKALLINTANDMDDATGNTGPIPNRDEGWGQVDISKLQYPYSDPVPFYLEDETSVFTSSLEVDEYEIMVDRAGEPLRISLVWTDQQAPSGTGGGRTLINDLNLEVVSPGGLIYRGNAFVDGWTAPNTNTMSDFDYSGDGWDDTNNVENVFIPTEDVELGVYTVRVVANNINGDAVNLGYNSQDYALAVYNGKEEILGNPPEVTVDSPNGGEVWYAYDDEYITWTTTETDDPIDYVNLAYSTDNGGSWTEIDSGIPDTGSYLWSIPNVNSDQCLVRVEVYDTAGRKGEDTSNVVFEIVGAPPAAPLNLVVEHYGENIEVLFQDDVEGGDLGYTTGESHVNASDWGIRSHGASSGVNSWDWGDGLFNKDSEEGMLSWLITPEINIPASADAEHGVMFTFQHWRDFGDDSLYDAGNVKISTDGAGGPWTLIVPEEGYDGTVPDGWGNPLGGEQAYGGTSDWTTATFDLTGYIGESIHIRWDAGVEAWDGYYGPGWRVDDIYMEALVVNPEGTEHNLLTWDASPDDPDEVSHYNIYRSEEQTGPWDGTTLIDGVAADGSLQYSYLDPDRGTADEILWWYVVRAVGTNGLEEGNTDAVQEPGEITNTFDISLSADGEANRWNFVSFNLIPSDTSLTAIIENETYGISGNYESVMYYDASEDQWSSYVPGRVEHFNNLISWDHTMGIWIRMTTVDTLTVEGSLPTTTDITLYPGWNMVGYPSNTVSNNGLPLEVDKIGYFDAFDEYNVAYHYEPEQFEFEPGSGYLIHNPTTTSTIWSVDYIDEEPAPAELILHSWSVNPEVIEPGESVTISGQVENIGGETGSDYVDLYVDSVFTDDEYITLGPGDSTTVTFVYVDTMETGMYDVLVEMRNYNDDWNSSFEVVNETNEPVVTITYPADDWDTVSHNGFLAEGTHEHTTLMSMNVYDYHREEWTIDDDQFEVSGSNWEYSVPAEAMTPGSSIQISVFGWNTDYGWGVQVDRFANVSEEGPTVIFSEDFNHGGAFPNGWVTFSEGPDEHPWTMEERDGSDYWAECDSDAAGTGTNITEWLYMDVGFNASGYSSLELEFYLDYSSYDGSCWAQVLYATSESFPTFYVLEEWTADTEGTQTIDLSVVDGEQEVHLAFRYHATWDWWMRVDDVIVRGIADSPTGYGYEPINNPEETLTVSLFSNQPVSNYEESVCTLDRYSSINDNTPKQALLSDSIRIGLTTISKN